MSVKSVLKQVYDHLKKSGFDVYFPGQHKGDCENKYIVLKMDGGTVLETVSSERPIYTVMCYVPERKYSELADYVLDVKDKMRGVYPMLMYAGNETPSYFDESVSGHMVSFQYQGIRKLKYIL